MNAFKTLLLSTPLALVPLSGAAQPAGQLVTLEDSPGVSVSRSGPWFPSATSASVPGQEIPGGTMVLLPAGVNVEEGEDPLDLPAATLAEGTTLRGDVIIELTAGLGGEPGTLALAYPSGASNVDGLLVEITSPSGITERRVTLLPAMGDAWVPVAPVEAEDGATILVRLVADGRTGSPDEVSPPVLALSALNISPEPFQAEEVADPFAADAPDAEEPAEDPFAAPAEPEQDRQPDAEDPFAAPISPVDDPFATPAEEVFDDPFAPAEGSDDPFAAPAEPAAEEPDFVDPFSPEGREEMARATPAPTPAETPAPTRIFSEPEPVVALVELNFHDSFESARRASAESGRPLLLLFSGESATARQFEELLRHPDVADVLGSFELARVNYRENRAFAHRYSVRSFPYIVLVNDLGYTEDHLLPTRDRDALIRRLMPHTQAHLRW